MNERDSRRVNQNKASGDVLLRHVLRIHWFPIAVVMIPGERGFSSSENLLRHGGGEEEEEEARTRPGASGAAPAAVSGPLVLT